MLSKPIESDYRQLTSESAYVRIDSPTLIRLTGADRAALMHNFCTADVNAMSPGDVCEAFVLNTKGKLLSHVHVMADDDSLLLLTVPEQFEAVRDHLDLYIIREDVAISDVSSEYECVFVTGNHSSGKLSIIAGALPVRNHIKHPDRSFPAAAAIERIANLELAGFGFLVFCMAGQIDALLQHFDTAAIPAASMNALDVIRIESATPRFGIDSSEANLPQELQRDEHAISFDKGCYLGQETVARIDAMGHVNQLFVQMQLDHQPESLPVDLVLGEKKAGTITSVCWSPVYQSWLGLGFVRSVHAKEGTVLTAPGGSCSVLDA